MTEKSNSTERDFELFTIEPDFESMKKSPQFYEYIHWKELKDRILLVNMDIGDELVEEVIMPIIKWNKEDEDKNVPVDERKPIMVYINSRGGDLDMGFLAISVFAKSKTPIYTVALGKAYSCGALLLLAGHKRFAYAYSNILIHEGTTGIMNTTSKTRDYMDFAERREAKLKEFIVSRTNIDPEYYDKVYRKEWYLLGEEALEFGIIDSIVE